MGNNPDTHIYDKLRSMLGGKLPVPQFEAAKRIIASGYREDFRIALGLNATQSNDQRIDLVGEQFIKSYEKLELTAYKPIPTDPWTIGWGSTTDLNGKPIQKGSVISKDMAEKMFRKDVSYFENIVNETITATITQNQFNALVSFVYNNGETNFIKGSVDDLINQGNMKAAYAVWARYINSAGKPVPGLVNRRNAEIALAKRS